MLSGLLYDLYRTWTVLDARLDNLAQVTGRAKASVLQELIEQGLDDLEDAVTGCLHLLNTDRWYYRVFQRPGPDPRSAALFSWCP
jgi:hypothetical protein